MFLPPQPFPKTARAFLPVCALAFAAAAFAAPALAAHSAAARKAAQKSAYAALYAPPPLRKIDFAAAQAKPLECLSAADLAALLGQASAPIVPAGGQLSEKAPAAFMCGQAAPAAYQSASVYAERDIAAAVLRFYSRAAAPVWSDAQGRLTPQAEQILAYLAKAGQDGLNPADYLPPLPPAGKDGSLAAKQAERQAATAAEFDIALSARLLRYISDMQNGRVPARAFARSYDLPAGALLLDAALARLAASPAPAEILASYRPRSAWYQALQAELAALNEKQANLAILPEAKAEAADFDRKKQAVLNGLERLRWLPHSFPEAYIFVNIPAFQAQFFDKSGEKLTMKAVVGAPGHPTNSFVSKVEQIVFNPSWGVPYSIMKNEMAAKIAKDPSYPARHGYEITRNGRRVAPASVNWAEAARTGGIQIRQKPGRNNALGRLKILFPNAYNIYMHDTPAKSAFTRDNRAISHGCVRLADPEGMAAALLEQDKSALSAYFKRPENGIKPKREIAVYLAYFTAWPQTPAGEMRYYADIYGLDMPLRLAEAAVELSRRQAEAEQEDGKTETGARPQNNEAAADISAAKPANRS